LRRKKKVEGKKKEGKRKDEKRKGLCVRLGKKVDRIGPLSILFFLKPPYSLNYNIAPTLLVLYFLNCYLTPYI
jgi:hypothetical protein